jgi:hypothetical protein
MTTNAAVPLTYPALCALTQPGSGSVPNGIGVGAPTSIHWTNKPSLQPSELTQSEQEQLAIIKNTVIVQHVNAMTFIGRVTVIVSIVVDILILP